MPRFSVEDIEPKLGVEPRFKLDDIEPDEVRQIGPRFTIEDIERDIGIPEPVAPRQDIDWAKVSRWTLGLFDFLLLPGDITRAAIYDLFLRQPGEQSEFMRLFREEFWKYAPGGEAPQVKSFAEVLAEQSDLSPRMAMFLGTALDILADPTIVAGGLFKASMKTAEKAVGREAAKALSGMRWTDIAEYAKQMPEGPVRSQLLAAASLKRGSELLTPAGLARELIPSPVKSAVDSAIKKFLSKENPFFYKEFIAPTQKGGVGKRRERLTWAEVLQTEPEAMKTLAGPYREVAEEIYGSGDILRSSVRYEPGALQRARATGQHIRNVGLTATAEFQRIFKDIVGLKPEQAPALYRDFQNVLADFVENTGGTLHIGTLTPSAKTFKRIRDMSPKELLESNFIKSWEGAFTGQYWKKTEEKIRALARAYQLDPDAMIKAAQESLKLAEAVHFLTGYYLSGMHRVDEVIMSSIPELKKIFKGDVSNDLLSTLAWKAIWVKAGGKVPLLESERKVLKVIEDGWRALGYEDTYGVSFYDFIKSLDEGYMRRVVPIRDPAVAKALLEGIEQVGFRWYPAQSLYAKDVVKAVEEVAGKEAADRLAAHLLVRGDGVMSLADIAAATGMDEAQVLDLLEKLGIEASDVVEKLKESLGTGRRADVARFEIGKQKWQERVLEKDKLYTEFLGMVGLPERMAAYATAAGRSITAQEFIAELYPRLADVGAIKESTKELFVKGSRVYDKQGVEYMKIPNHPDLWGPLAGKWIPSVFAKPMLTALEIGDPGLFQEVLSTFRALALSSPDTVIRNVGGGIRMLRDLGLSWRDIGRYGREAVRLFSRFKEEGDPRIFGDGWQALNLYEDGKLYSEVERDIIESVGGALYNPSKGTLRKIRDAITRAPESPLRWFQVSEDLMRLTAFLAKKDQLIKLGLDPKKAGAYAAKFANNALFDYATQPFIVQKLKESGLSFFPAFTFFNIGRSFQLAAERPWVVTLAADQLMLANLAIAHGDPEEYRRRMEMVKGTWMENQQPLLVPIADKVYAIPMAPFLPVFAIEPDSSLTEIATGGIARPLVAATMAWLFGETPEFERKYGKEVFPPYVDTQTKAIKTVEYLLRSYLVGFPRKATQVVEAFMSGKLGNEEDYYYELYGREFKPTVRTAALNMLISARPINELYKLRAIGVRRMECRRLFNRARVDAQKLLVAGRKDRAIKVLQAGAEQAYKCEMEVMKELGGAK